MNLNKRYTLTTEQGIVSDEGIGRIVRFIRAQDLRAKDWQALNPGLSTPYLPPLPTDWDWVWMTREGAFTKRVSKFYYQTYSIKSPQGFIQELGNIARTHSLDGVTYRFEFVDTFDWEAGEFGDSRSCFWGSNYMALDMLRDNRALAVRFYGEAGSGCARAWVAVLGEALYVVFNGYGFAGNPTLVIARVLALHLSLSYKRIALTNNRTASGTLWINGGIGYLVGSPERIASQERHDLGWDELVLCFNCGEVIDASDTYTGADDNLYCEYCFSDLFSYCDHCGETVWYNDMAYAEGEYVCEYCLRDHYTRCDKCRQYVRNDYVKQAGSRRICDSCQPSHS